VQHDDAFVASDHLSNLLVGRHLTPALERLVTAAQLELAATEGSGPEQEGKSAGYLASFGCSLPGQAGVSRSRAGSSMARGGSSSSSSKERAVAERSMLDTLQCALMLAADVQQRRLQLLGVDTCCCVTQEQLQEQQAHEQAQQGQAQQQGQQQAQQGQAQHVIVMPKLLFTLPTLAAVAAAPGRARLACTR
jgi:hypothetical protein